MAFSKGLAEILSKGSGGGGSSEYNKEYADMLLTPEKDTKYIVRFLAEPTDLIAFPEHNYIPTTFTTQAGEEKPGFGTFMCEDTPDCPLCNMTIRDQKTGDLKKLKARRVLALPVFVKETKITKKNKEVVDDVEESKVIILPPGKSNVNWKQIYSSAENRGHTLTDRYYVIEKTGEGLETSWSIQPLDKSDFEYNDVEPIDVEAVIKKSGRWKDYRNRHPNLSVNTGIDATDSENIEESNDLIDQL